MTSPAAPTGTWPPTTHQHVQDQVTQLRTAPPPHVHGVTDITATGTRSSSTFLRGDGTWSTVSSTGSGSTATMAVESDAGVSVANTGTVNRANLSSWTAANPGKPIFFRAGIYDFSGGVGQSAVEMKGSIFGAGPGVSVLRFPESEYACIYYRNVNDITVADIEIRNTGTKTPYDPLRSGTNAVFPNQPWSNLLTFDNVQNPTARNVYVQGGANIGIMHTNGCTNITTIGCRVRGTTRDGIHYTQATRVTCIGNVVWDTGDDCIAVIGYNGDTMRPTKVTIAGNVLSNLRARGITCEGGQNVTITGNTIDGVASNGILLNSIGSVTTDTWGSENVTVTGNTIRNAGGAGVHINGKTDGLRVANNTIEAPTGHGIEVLRGRPVIENNTIDDAGNVGIFLTVNGSAMDKTIIRGNTIRRPQSRGIYTQAAGKLVVTDNVVQEPSENGSAAAAIQIEQGTNHWVTGNRVDATNSTRTPSAILLYQSTNSTVAGNYQVGAGTLFTNDSSTGITTTF